MYAKHFFKRVLIFTLIIAVGMFGLYLINRAYQTENGGVSLDINNPF